MKRFIVGFLAGTLIFGSVGAFAASGNMIEVFYNIKGIKINNVTQMPEQKPFIYQGTTFVPLRYVSEKLGKPVKWDSKTQTIIIGETADSGSVFIGDSLEYMNYQAGYIGNTADYKFNSTKKVKDNLGNEYENYLVLGISKYSGEENAWNYVEFPLNGQYKTFKAIVGITEQSKETTDQMKLEIFNDDKLVKTINVSAGDMTKDINIKVENTLKIKFKLSTLSEDDAQIGLFNPHFLK